MAKYTLNIARFLKYVWPFYNIMHEGVKRAIHGINALCIELAQHILVFIQVKTNSFIIHVFHLTFEDEISNFVF